jgi:hypothetical protein
VFGRGSPRKELFAHETPAHVLTDDSEYLADLVGVDGARVSLRFFVSSHVDKQWVTKVYPTDHPEPEFPDQSNHSLGAAAQEPFWTTGELGDGLFCQ